MVVYVIVESIENYCVQAVFSDREIAEQYIGARRFEIEEYEVDERIADVSFADGEAFVVFKDSTSGNLARSNKTMTICDRCSDLKMSGEGSEMVICDRCKRPGLGTFPFEFKVGPCFRDVHMDLCSECAEGLRPMVDNFLTSFEIPPSETVRIPVQDFMLEVFPEIFVDDAMWEKNGISLPLHFLERIDCVFFCGGHCFVRFKSCPASDPPHPVEPG